MGARDPWRPCAETGRTHDTRTVNEPSRTTTSDVFPAGFVSFWNAYPKTQRKVGKEKCRAFWKQKSLEPLGAEIAAHVSAVAPSWLRPDGDGKTFEPQPLKYLKEARWEAGLPVAAKRRGLAL